jgi:hypothetical protein
MILVFTYPKTVEWRVIDTEKLELSTPQMCARRELTHLYSLMEMLIWKIYPIKNQNIRLGSGEELFWTCNAMQF